MKRIKYILNYILIILLVPNIGKRQYEIEKLKKEYKTKKPVH